MAKKIFEELHEEYHKAEERVCKKLGIKISPSDRAKGVVAYLSCVAVTDARIKKRFKK